MQQKISLDRLKKGDKAIIDSFASDILPAKFYELGFAPGSVIIVKHKAPFNGPICVNIQHDDSLIAIRKTEAALILARKI
ncbi:MULTISPECIES: ferrous iron transport protein A [Sphingobacterium]|uniref:Ferrous iron transporter FeoA-like domain-containing protein n=1 Tax=Sphingobacterium thermophilum TaxID=768534 RepID=A0ABP8QVL4_9SPHI|nr:FeoA family protein [Sphingobacterium sp. T2]